MELNKREQEILAMGAKMKTLEEQHHDYQRHIAVLKESLCAKEEHQNMLQADVRLLSSPFLHLPLSRFLPRRLALYFPWEQKESRTAGCVDARPPLRLP